MEGERKGRDPLARGILQGSRAAGFFSRVRLLLITAARAARSERYRASESCFLSERGPERRWTSELEWLVEIAEEDEMFPLVKIGDSGFYTVCDGRNRSLEHNRAHAKHFDPDQSPTMIRGHNITQREDDEGLESG